MSATTDTKHWRKTLRKAKLPQVRIHSARHTMATLLTEAGVDDKTRILLMGHTKPSTTAGYTHIDTHHLLGAVDLADRMLTSK